MEIQLVQFNGFYNPCLKQASKINYVRQTQIYFLYPECEAKKTSDTAVSGNNNNINTPYQ